MVKVLHGEPRGQGRRVGIAVARFNELVTEKLLDGAVATLRQHGVADGDVTVAWVPGAFEIPTAASWAARSGSFDAVVCIGAVIRGDTAHFEYVAGECTKGLAQVSMEYGVPVAFGVLTVDSIEQAIERSGTKAGNKGGEAALSALEMVSLLTALEVK